MFNVYKIPVTLCGNGYMLVRACSAEQAHQALVGGAGGGLNLLGMSTNEIIEGSVFQEDEIVSVGCLETVTLHKMDYLHDKVYIDVSFEEESKTLKVKLQKKIRSGLKYVNDPHCNRHPRSVGDNRPSGCTRADELSRKAGKNGAVHCHGDPALHVGVDGFYTHKMSCKNCRPKNKK